MRHQSFVLFGSLLVSAASLLVIAPATGQMPPSRPTPPSPVQEERDERREQDQRQQRYRDAKLKENAELITKLNQRIDQIEVSIISLTNQLEKLANDKKEQPFKARPNRPPLEPMRPRPAMESADSIVDQRKVISNLTRDLEAKAKLEKQLKARIALLRAMTLAGDEKGAAA